MKRSLLVATREMQNNLRRPMYWVWTLLFVFLAFGLSRGNVSIQTSGDNSVGGVKQWLTSEYSVAQLLSATNMMLAGFFTAIAAGLTIMNDHELRIPELLHSTPLRIREYVWGKFIGCMMTFTVIIGIQLLAMIFFYQVFPSPLADEIRGPFNLLNYLRPALMFSVPLVVFFSGLSFAVGTWTRRPILIFVLPTVLLLLFGVFLSNWSPGWLSNSMNRMLMLVDPYGNRWLTETWLKIDLGATHYNTQPIGYDAGFVISRLAFVLLGLAPVAWVARYYAGVVRMTRHGTVQAGGSAPSAPVTAPGPVVAANLTSLGMLNRPVGWIRGIGTVAYFELKLLIAHPALYLFVPFIIIQTFGQVFLNEGVFQTPVLFTSGVLAMRMMNTLTLLVCLLLMFYVVESLQRERAARLAPIYDSSGTPPFSILTGKVLANSLVGLAVLLATWITCVCALLWQGTVPIEIKPFLVVWGLMMLPTFILWSSFVSLLLAVTRNRYTTYATAGAALTYTFYRQFTGKMNWVGNWNLWSIGNWSDISTFEADGTAIIMNRMFVLSVAILFIYAAVKLHGRREFDASRIVHRLRPASLARLGLSAAPFLAAPLLLGTILWFQVQQGLQGKAIEKEQKNYWKQNLATWKDAPTPAISNVDLDLKLDPDRHWFQIQGSYVLKNQHEESLLQIPLTVGTHFEDMQWTLDEKQAEPDDRSRLMVFDLDEPLTKGQTVEIGFSYHGQYPKGISKNGGAQPQFILPSGVVLTSFGPTFTPVVGYVESIGVDEDNSYESKKYAEQHFEGVTPPLFGGGDTFNTRIRVTGPSRFVYNSVGTLTEMSVEGDQRTMVWESDHPVSFFNVVAGDWKVHEGEHTKIYYDPRHNYNIDEIAEGLDASYKYYSEWFAPYPWQELKLSEFANLATYAQGFPTNITFSEGIGFLTRNDGTRANATFLVTAHEAAHQWWGNLLVPGKGPGGNILSEGMAHFSTGLLIEQVKGEQGRIEFFDGIERTYGLSRRADAERPLVEIDGSRDGDTTVTYDKGGWVFWMLLNHMGRENNLEGIQQFVRHYSQSPDHPVLQDFVRALRPYAEDEEAYDRFTQQWFHEVVVPQYKLSDVKRVELSGGKWKTTGTIKNVGTGIMPIELCAAVGERFNDDGQQHPDFSEERTIVTLGSDDAMDFEIISDFKPDRVIVDPDRMVLQLKRKKSLFEF